jgi:hypothetical protein
VAFFDRHFRRFAIGRRIRSKKQNVTPSDNNRYLFELFLRSLKFCDSSKLTDMVFSYPFFPVTEIDKKSSRKILGSACSIL